jgi:hypothetical protein
MRTQRINLHGLFIIAFAVGIGQAQAAPIGERRVSVDHERLQNMSPEDQQAVLIIQQRLEGILATDRSTLNREQRKELRAEYKGLEREMEHYNAGGTVIYVSTAGIIIILLLLIILL